MRFFSPNKKGRQELHAHRVQVSRTVRVVHVAHLLAQDAALPRRGQPAQRKVRRRRQSHPRWVVSTFCVTFDPDGQVTEHLVQSGVTRSGTCQLNACQPAHIVRVSRSFMDLAGECLLRSSCTQNRFDREFNALSNDIQDCYFKTIRGRVIVG